MHAPTARGSPQDYARSLYAVVLFCLVLKLFSYLSYFESVGVHVLIIAEVVAFDVSVFIVIVGVISTAVGLALTLMLAKYESTLGTDNLASRPFFIPFWALTGYISLPEVEERAGMGGIRRPRPKGRAARRG